MNAAYVLSCREERASTQRDEGLLALKDHSCFFHFFLLLFLHPFIHPFVAVLPASNFFLFQFLPCLVRV